MPRVQTNQDLGGLPQLQAPAHPVDNYYRPDVPNIPHAPTTNGWSQVADALKTIQPELEQFGTEAVKTHTEQQKIEAKALAARLAELSNNDTLTSLTKHLSTQEQQQYRGVLQSSFFPSYYNTQVAGNLFDSFYSNIDQQMEQQAKATTDVHAPEHIFNAGIDDLEKTFNGMNIPIADRYAVYNKMSTKRTEFVTKYQKVIGKNQYDESQNLTQATLSSGVKDFVQQYSSAKDPVQQTQLYSDFSAHAKETLKAAVDAGKMLPNDANDALAGAVTGYIYSHGNINPDDPADHTAEIAQTKKFASLVGDLSGIDGRPVFIDKRGKQLGEARKFLSDLEYNETNRYAIVAQKALDKADNDKMNQALDVIQSSQQGHAVLTEDQRGQIFQAAQNIKDAGKRNTVLSWVNQDDKKAADLQGSKLVTSVYNGDSEPTTSPYTVGASPESLVSAARIHAEQQEKGQNKETKAQMDAVKTIAKVFNDPSSNSPGILQAVLFPFRGTSPRRKAEHNAIMAQVTGEFVNHALSLQEKKHLSSEEIRTSMYQKAYDLGRLYQATPKAMQDLVNDAARHGVTLGAQKPAVNPQRQAQMKQQFQQNQQMLQELQKQINQLKGAH